MMKLCFLLLAIASVFGQNEITIQEMVESHCYFSIDLYMELIKQTEDNIAYSAISLQTALALTTLGAKGATADQLRSTMHMNLTDEQIKKVFNLITTKLNDVPDITIKMANRAYLADGLNVQPEFLKVAKADFNAGVDNVNFAASQETAAQINEWVEKETNDKIKNLITKDQIDSDTRFVLLNALYLRGNWLKPFDASATEKKDFHVSATETVQVDTMRVKTNIRISKIPKFKLTLLELPFENRKGTFTLYIPDEIDGHIHVGKNVKEIWESRNFTTEYVELFLPKFRVESTIDMIPILKKLGITNLFTEGQADLSGITEENVFVSSVRQKTYVDVNEFGVEAASATAVVGSKRVGFVHRGDPLIIRVNHPFVYCIQYEEIVLMAGRVKTF